jgi:hypothetical protein
LDRPQSITATSVNVAFPTRGIAIRAGVGAIQIHGQVGGAVEPGRAGRVCVYGLPGAPKGHDIERLPRRPRLPRRRRPQVQVPGLGTDIGNFSEQAQRKLALDAGVVVIHRGNMPIGGQPVDGRGEERSGRGRNVADVCVVQRRGPQRRRIRGVVAGDADGKPSPPS